MKEINFEDVYEGFHLNTLHRYFSGNNSSLLAVFAVFELMHNFRDLVNYAKYKDKRYEYVLDWYKKDICNIHSFINPGVYKFIYEGKWLSKKAKNKILKDAQNEFNYILESKGIKKFITDIIEGGLP